MELCKSQFINPTHTSPRTPPFRGPLTNQPGRGKERANPINDPESTGPSLEGLLH